jgi:tetratricopeptide (TPR) repeat protein
VAFVLKRTGREKTATEGEKTAAGQLADELGDLPLALEQAGAYIEACGCSIGHYLDLFRTRRQELLRRGQSSQEYPDTVATTWELSFQKVQEASPAAADLLNLCAFLAPDDIPKELLVEGAKHVPQSLAAAVQDPVAMNDALAVLRRYSLMEVADEALAMHRLVQAVVRDRLGEEEQKQWAGDAVEMVGSAFPPGNFDENPETWPWCARLLPHALAAAGRAEALRVALPAAGGLLNQAGYYLQIRAEFTEAKKAFERTLSISANVLDLNHPIVASAENNLGTVLQAMGALQEAKAHYERALAIFEIIGPNNAEVAAAQNNLGLLLRELGDMVGARVHFERALVIGETVYGTNHPKVALLVNNQGVMLKALGDLAGAREHYERALTIDEAAYGPNHHKVAIRVNNLGDVLQDLGDLEGAKVHYERALAIDKAAYGPNHPVVARDVNNLGSVLRALGDLAGAKAHFERALAIWKEKFGLSHPMVARAANNLGTVLKDLGDLAGARAHYERALAIFRQFLGEDHPKTKLVKRNLAALGLPVDE